MSNNYRHFLLSPSKLRQQKQQQQQQQQQAMTRSAGTDPASCQAGGLESHYDGPKAKAESSNNKQQPARQRLVAAYTTSGRQHAEHPQNQPQAANYCQSQIQSNTGPGHRLQAVNLAHRQQHEHQSIQSGFAPSAQSPGDSGRPQHRLGAKSLLQQPSPSPAPKQIDGDESLLLRREQELRQLQQHYIRQVNSANSNSANINSSNGYSSIERAQQQQQQQQQQSSRSWYHQQDNDNIAATRNIAHNNLQNQFACDKNDLRSSYHNQNITLNQSNIRYNCQEQELLDGQMAKLLSNNNNNNSDKTTSAGQVSAAATTSSGHQIMKSSTNNQNYALGDEEDEGDHQYADQLRKNQFNQFTTNARLSSNSNQQHSLASPPKTTIISNHNHASTRQTNKDQTTMQLKQQQQQQPQAVNEESTGAMGNNSKGEQHRPLHVNFNRRSSQANESDNEEECETRKKKYLTAKYGQQQMNLIKKRLKIEMWLHEQIQELAKQSKTLDPDEVDEIDIDLDQLLDMDCDATRRHWLRRTLEPLDDVPEGKIEQFIDEVLDQSKLL